MSEFWNFAEAGWRHVVNIRNCSFILFLIALATPYSFKEWKKILLLASIFSIGYFVSMVLSVFGVVIIKDSLIAFLIPITIFVAAVYNLLTSGKSFKNTSINAVGFVTLFFGMLHGLEFSNYFKSIYFQNTSNKIVSLFEYAVGIFAVQILTVASVLIVAYIIHAFYRFSKRDFTLVLSAFIIGVVLPEILENEIWK